MKICIVEGCERKHHAKGYCKKHDVQFRRHGKILKRTRFDPNEITILRKTAHIHLYDIYGEETWIAIIDKEDVDRCKDVKWCLCNGYIIGKVNRKPVYLHNFILERKSDGMIEPDHINRKKHDCRKENLRLCQHWNNTCNIGHKKHNTSGLKGICFDKQRNLWISSIRANNKIYNLGRFKDKVEAAKVYDKKAIELHGEFAVLNFPNEVQP